MTEVELLTNTVRDLEDVDSVIDQARSHLCAKFLNVQRAVSLLKHHRHTDELRAAVDKCTLDLVDIGGAFESVSSKLQLDVYQQRTLIEASIKALRSTIGALQQKADASTARLREHAMHSTSVREAVWAITDGKCFYCETALIREGVEVADGRPFHIDHLVAKANGGPDHLSNYVPACDRCNVSKGDKSFVEFTRKRQVQLAVIEGGR